MLHIQKDDSAMKCQPRWAREHNIRKSQHTRLCPRREENNYLVENKKKQEGKEGGTRYAGGVTTG